jgi:DNA polymerase-1
MIVCDMERTGFLIDAEILKHLSSEFETESTILKSKIFTIAGTEFNIASPKQIGEILFDVLKIETTGKQKTTATGQAATGADILDDLALEGHEIAELILKWRGLQKLKSTYCDSLQTHVDDKTGRVHSSFHLTGAATGRFSSSDPNLQNIPIKTPEGRKIREAFKSDVGKSIVAADYSQIELRILAHIADIPLLKHAFLNNEDIHARTASEVFNIPLEQVTNDIRRKAKAVNFGIIYGISAFGLARQLKIPQSEAKSYIDSYFARLPEVKTYMETTKAFAHAHHYVMTPFGRKVWFKDIESKNHSLRSFSERAAINAPIQGAAADSIKYAMIDADILLKTEFTDCKMLSQVHDELIFEVPDNRIADFTERLKHIMQQAPQKQCALSVPLVVDIGIGKNWEQAH